MKKTNQVCRDLSSKLLVFFFKGYFTWFWDHPHPLWLAPANKWVAPQYYAVGVGFFFFRRKFGIPQDPDSGKTVSRNKTPQLRCRELLTQKKYPKIQGTYIISRRIGVDFRLLSSFYSKLEPA